ncbi:ABC transporter substrate-binding protein [Thermodesulfobacteriota bacterium]
MMKIIIRRCIIIVLLILTGIFFPNRAQSDTRNVTDQLGRNITLTEDPKRVISLAPNSTEIIYALAQEHRLIGATRYSDYPPEALNLPRVGSYVHLDLEKIVALKPDLCIAIKDGNPIAVVKRLESLNIPVYAVDPRNTEAVIDTVIEIGHLLNADEKAKELARDMRLRIQKVKSMIAKTNQRPRVFFQIGITPIVSAGTRTFIHELIGLAGGKNLAEGPTVYPRYSQEQVVALSPEVFIVSSMTRQGNFNQIKAEWSQWTDLPAVRNQRIFLVDSNLFDRPSPRLVDALELLVPLIHPELFEVAQ